MVYFFALRCIPTDVFKVLLPTAARQILRRWQTSAGKMVSNKITEGLVWDLMMRKKILRIGILAIFLSIVTNAYCSETYYEVWRSPHDDPGNMIRLEKAKWLQTTTHDDDTAVPGEKYTYWVRVVTTETAYSFVNNFYYGPFYIEITCPTAAERSDNNPSAPLSPIRVNLSLGNESSYPNVTANINCAIKEADFGGGIADDFMKEWFEPDVTPNGWSVVRTKDVDISAWEASSTAEVYFYATYLDPTFYPFYLTLETRSNLINVALRDFSDDPPSNIRASQGTYPDKVHVSWNPVPVSENRNSGLTSCFVGWASIADTTAPTPNPMTWSTEPYETSTSSISMVATAASDASSPVEYEFDFTSSPTGGSGGSDRSWNTSRTYTDSGLQANHQYGYRVRARDSAPSQNTTNYSPVSYEYTEANPPGSAAFSNVTRTSIQANWTANGNPGGTEYYCENTTLGTNSRWITETYWNSTGLSSATPYTFQVKARNGDLVPTGTISLGSQMTHYEPVITAITPDSGPAGTYMKIEGQYFYDSGSVIFANNAPGEILDWNDTVIHCKVLASATTGSVIVQTTANSNGKIFIVTDPNTIYVDHNSTPNIENGTPEKPFSTVQRGIDAATTSDEVIVADGIYTGEGNRYISFNGKAITVRSENGPNTCIIDCQQQGNGFYFHRGEDQNSVLDGFTITNGLDMVDEGGGIGCYESSPTIKNCGIIGNRAQGLGDGGGILLTRSNAKIMNCLITYNIASYGGGIYCSGNPTIVNCLINSNAAFDRGGGIAYTESNGLTLDNCTFSNNSSQLGGGGFFADRYSTSTLINCIFSGNRASQGGGVDYHYGALTLTGCRFKGNSSVGEWGGAMFCYGATVTLTNCILIGNSAMGGSGGGMYNWDSSLVLANCTFSGNLAESYGGGIYNEGSDANLTNCILWGNSASQGSEIYLGKMGEYPSTMDVNYSDVGGWDTNIYMDPNCTLNWGEGNLDADPCCFYVVITVPVIITDPFTGRPKRIFVHKVTGDGHLLPTSPCIDAGDPNYPEDANEVDIDGDARVIGGRIDIGADEYRYGELCDLYQDGIVNFKDFSILAYYWQDYVCDEPDWCEGCDYNQSGAVDNNDLRRFAENWLWQAIWYSQ